MRDQSEVVECVLGRETGVAIRGPTARKYLADNGILAGRARVSS